MEDREPPARSSLEGAASSPQSAAGAELCRRNRSFYDSIWRSARVRRAEWFITWDSMRELIEGRKRRLEIGPGVRPRLPLEGTVFLDLSPVATMKLQALGASVVLGNLEALPFADGAFDLVCALDVIEHVHDQEGAFREISRAIAPGGILVLAVPLHPRHWTEYDHLVGHQLRYDPAAVRSLIEKSGFEVLRSAGSGILPANRRFVQIGAWVLARVRAPAVWFEDRIVLPIARLFEKRVEWREGFHVPPGAAGVILVCRRARDESR